MLKTLTIVGLALVAAVALLLMYAATRPDDFRLSRTTTIEAPAAAIFPLLADLHRFNEWNPFAAADPAIRFTYGERSAGVGAHCRWESSGPAGKGRMEITAARAPMQLEMNLQFEKPMQASNHVVFTLRPQGSATEVVWEMTGRNGLLPKVFGVIFNMDKMVGGEFEKGLAALRTKAESREAATPHTAI